MANCIKTGCHVYLAEYHVYLRGDAFALDINDGEYTHYYFRLNNRSTSTVKHDEPLHFTVTHIDSWFDTGRDGTSTLVARFADYHGYNGSESNVVPLRAP